MSETERAERARAAVLQSEAQTPALCASSMRERISCEMATMDVDALNALYLEALAIRQWGPSDRAVIDETLAAAVRWERAQGGTEEAERLRAAVVAMRGGK